MYAWLALAVFLYVICAVLIIIEIFRPSKGLASISAMAFLIGGVAIFFRQGIKIGWVGIAVAVVVIPAAVVIAYKMHPRA